MKQLLAGFLMAMAPLVAWSQEQDNPWQDKLDFDVSAGGFYLSAGTDNDRKIDMPEYLKTIRQETNALTNSFERERDNPLIHGAFFLGLHTKYKVRPWATVYFDFIGEHRGTSYGVYDTENMVVFPRVYIDLHRKYMLLKKPLQLKVAMGNQVNQKLYEGLMIYNIDAQGLEYSIKWGKFKYRYVKIADLFRGIGLNIDDGNDFIFSFDSLALGNKWKTDIQAGYGSYSRLSLVDPHNFIFKLSAGIYPNQNLRIYAQSAFREREPGAFSGSTMNWAFLAGTRHSFKSKRLQLRNTFEVRFYGGGFNADYKNTSTAYRDVNGGAYANTVGPALYPIMNYTRPFSQWAAFAEYQQNQTNIGLPNPNNDPKDITGLVWQGYASYNFFSEFHIHGALDVNVMLANELDAFIYPFYTAGIGWKPDEQTTVSLIVTNKGMNLDLHYPTFYLYEQPYLGYSLTRKINWQHPGRNPVD